MTDKEKKAIKSLKIKDEYIGENYSFGKQGIKNLKNELKIVLNLIEKQDKMINEVLEKIFEYASFDGEHHKNWLIDQIVKTLTKDNYKKWVEEYEDGEEGKHTYKWDVGIAP